MRNMFDGAGTIIIVGMASCALLGLLAGFLVF